MPAPPIFDHDDLRRHRLFNGPQIDPTRRAKKLGLPHYARRTQVSRALMPDDFMPIGPHAGKHLRAVPTDYLLWVNAQPWSKTWSQWQPIADYISRHPLSQSPSLPVSQSPDLPIIFVDPLQQWPHATKIFRAGSSHLHTLPGYLDHLHTFAMAALSLRPEWMQHEECPHYDLTVAKHQFALEAGATLIDRRSMAAHIILWRDFRNAKPKPLPDPSTHTRIANDTLR